MKKNNKINSFSLSTLVVALSGAPFWGILTSYIFKLNGVYIIFSMPICFILSLLISKIFLKFFNIYPNANGINKILNIYGKTIGNILNFIIRITALLIYIFLAYRLASFLSSQYLIETNPIYIYIMILFVTLLLANKGLETLTRVSTISLFISLILFLFNIFNLIKYININNYLPISLESINVNNFVKSIVIFTLIYTVPMFFLYGTKKDNLIDKENYHKYHYIMNIISFIIVYSSSLVTLGIYGINLTNLFDYPLYTVLKKISVFSFIDSIENISSMLWILYSINASSTILLSLFENQKETYNQKNTIVSKITIMTIAFLIPLIFFSNNNFVETFEYVKYPIIVMIIILVIVTLSIFINKIKRRN